MTARWSTLATAARLGVHLVLLVALGLGLVWPLVDPQAAERDPWHAHLVLGRTEAARAQALAAHVHAGLAGHTHPALSEPLAALADENGARVIVVGSHAGDVGSSIGLAAGAVLTPTLLALACLLVACHAVPQRDALPRPTALRRLDPPPRLPA